MITKKHLTKGSLHRFLLLTSARALKKETHLSEEADRLSNGRDTRRNQTAGQANSVLPRVQQWAGNLTWLENIKEKNTKPTPHMPIEIRRPAGLRGKADWAFRQTAPSVPIILFRTNVQTDARKKGWGQWPLQADMVGSVGTERGKGLYKIERRKITQI